MILCPTNTECMSNANESAFGMVAMKLSDVSPVMNLAHLSLLAKQGCVGEQKFISNVMMANIFERC